MIALALPRDSVLSVTDAYVNERARHIPAIPSADKRPLDDHDQWLTWGRWTLVFIVISTLDMRVLIYLQ